jgi:hypothetical protein
MVASTQHEEQIETDYSNPAQLLSKRKLPLWDKTLAKRMVAIDFRLVIYVLLLKARNNKQTNVLFHDNRARLNTTVRINNTNVVPHYANGLGSGSKDCLVDDPHLSPAQSLFEVV